MLTAFQQRRPDIYTHVPTLEHIPASDATAPYRYDPSTDDDTNIFDDVGVGVEDGVDVRSLVGRVTGQSEENLSDML